MKIARSISIYFLLTCSLLFAQSGPSLAHKQTNGPSQTGTKHPSYGGCDAATPTIMADGSVVNDAVAAEGQALYVLHLKGGHSYATEVWSTYGPDETWSNGRPALHLADNTCDFVSTTDVSGVDPALSSGFSGRISWVQSSDGVGVVDVINRDDINPYIYNLRVIDTTLFSPRWSTYSGFLTQWGFSNISNRDLAGVFTIFNAAGTAIKTVNVTVPAGKVKFYSSVSGDLNLPSNTAGSVMFAYIGPAGAIQADAAILNSSVTVVFPVKFEPRNYLH